MISVTSRFRAQLVLFTVRAAENDAIKKYVAEIDVAVPRRCVERSGRYVFVGRAFSTKAAHSDSGAA